VVSPQSGPTKADDLPGGQVRSRPAERFLEQGLDHIKPMTLLEVARELGLHESTIGRVVANKYLMTPLGLYPLKFFSTSR